MTNRSPSAGATSSPPTWRPQAKRIAAAVANRVTSSETQNDTPAGSRNSDEVTKESLDFCKWWLSTPIQKEFAKRGGQSALRSVYNDPEYLTYRPWNRAWGPSLDWQKDVWHVPDFYELLVNSQEEYNKAITGAQDAKTTMDNIAKFEEDLLTKDGLIQ
jgi:multiple sugar transport system substrate-binding protein